MARQKGQNKQRIKKIKQKKVLKKLDENKSKIKRQKPINAKSKKSNQKLVPSAKEKIKTNSKRKVQKPSQSKDTNKSSSRPRVTPLPGKSRGPHPRGPSDKDVMEIVSTLPKHGYVTMNSTGYVFLDLDDDWIFKLGDVMAEYGFETPPYFYGTEPTGAHVTMVPANLSSRFSKDNVPLGKKVNFQVVKAKVFYPKRRWYGTEAGYFVWIKSNELLKISRSLAGPRYNPSYGMFHIVVGVRSIKTRDEMLKNEK